MENFPNKFSANYLFVINQTESDIPRVNRPSIDLGEQMNAQWTKLKARTEDLLTVEIPSLNKKLFDVGFGAIWKH